MAGLILELDPAAEATGSPLLLTDTANGWALLEFDATPAPLNILYASSVDTEGEIPVSRRYTNRTITIKLVIGKTTDAALRTALDTISGKVGKLQRDGGTLKLTHPSGDTRVFDICAADYGYAFDKRYVTNKRAEVTLTLPAMPIARGAEIDLGDNVETTLPCLVFTEASIPGDVDALGWLVVDNDASADQWWVTWGLQSRTYSSSANAALFYEAEGRTAMGGSATAVAGRSPASGGGSNVMRNTALLTTFQAILGTQATGGGAHLSHVGTYRVYARALTSTAGGTGTVSLALEWGQGDYRSPTQNATVTIGPTLNFQWVIVDLGLINVPGPVQGTAWWEGRVLAKSTQAGDDVEIDWLMFVPVDEGSWGVAQAREKPFVPTSFSARDDFAQTAGALNGKTLPVGGTWATSGGDPADFSVSGSGNVTRAAVADVVEYDGRFALAGSATFTSVAASVDLTVSAGSATQDDSLFGVMLRYFDSTHWVAAVRYTSSLVAAGSGILTLVKRDGGSITYPGTTGVIPELAFGETATISATISAGGRWSLSVNGSVRSSGADEAFGTGGSIASGKVGLIDGVQNATFPTRTYDNFWAAVPPTDAAIYANQSMEIRHSGVVREDAAGVSWPNVSNFEGFGLRVPPSGAEGRTTRMIVKASRNAPGQGADSAIDDISARLFVTPRFLT